MAKAKKDQYTVVLEDIRDKFQVFGESLQFVRDDVKDIKKTLNSHGGELKSHTEMIGQLMADMTETKQDIFVLKKDVKEIRADLKPKVEKGDFMKLEKRVVRLETKRGFAGAGVAIIMALIVVVIAGGAYVMIRNSGPISLDGVQAPDETVKVEPSQNGWKTYTNEKYGFEIKMPRDFGLLSDYDASLMSEIIPNDLASGWIGQDGNAVFGLNIYRLIENECQFMFEDGQKIRQHSGYCYELAVNPIYRGDKEVIDAILSSFKFTQASSTAITTDVSISITGNVLSVVNKGEIIQMLTLDDAGDFALNIGAKGGVVPFVIDKDVNFDGYVDVGVLSSTGYAGVNYFYDFYLFNPSTNVFEKNEILVGVTATKIDSVKKEITSTYKSGPGYQTVIYRWDGSTFIKSPPKQEI